MLDARSYPSREWLCLRQNRRLHRVAWEAHNAEPIPEGMVVMHSCDNRECFNPAHLSVGTQQENIHDCIEKDRRSGARFDPDEINALNTETSARRMNCCVLIRAQ